MAPIANKMTICPRNIRYTQDSIKGEFMDGRAMWDTLEDLLYGRISVEHLPLIEVVREDGKWWALSGNRRLYLFRKLEDLGEVSTIPVLEKSLFDYGVRQRFDDRKTTTCGGKKIKMRQPEAECHFTSAIERWMAWKTVNRNQNESLEMNTSRHLPTEVSSNRATSVERNYVTLDVRNDDVNKVSFCGKRFVACTAVGLLLFLFALFVIYMTLK